MSTVVACGGVNPGWVKDMRDPDGAGIPSSAVGNTSPGEFCILGLQYTKAETLGEWGTGYAIAYDELVLAASTVKIGRTLRGTAADEPG